MKHAAAWLRRVARSRHADRLLLRGSLLTAQWVPGRPCADVDHLASPDATIDEVGSAPPPQRPNHDLGNGYGTGDTGGSGWAGWGS